MRAVGIILPIVKQTLLPSNASDRGKKKFSLILIIDHTLFTRYSEAFLRRYYILNHPGGFLNPPFRIQHQRLFKMGLQDIRNLRQYSVGSSSKKNPGLRLPIAKVHQTGDKQTKPSSSTIDQGICLVCVHFRCRHLYIGFLGTFSLHSRASI